MTQHSFRMKFTHRCYSEIIARIGIEAREIIMYVRARRYCKANSFDRPKIHIDFEFHLP